MIANAILVDYFMIAFSLMLQLFHSALVTKFNVFNKFSHWLAHLNINFPFQSLGPQEPSLVLPLVPQHPLGPHRSHRRSGCRHHGCPALALLLLQVIFRIGCFNSFSTTKESFLHLSFFIRITILKYPGIKDNNTREYKSYHGMIPRLWMVWAYTLNFDGVGCFCCFMIYWINIQMGSFLGVHFHF